MPELTISLKKRFLKDRNISLNVLEEPYFTERVILAGEKDNLDRYIKLIEKFPNEQDYLTLYNEVKDKAINFIKESEAYKSINENNFNKLYKESPKIIDNFPKTNVYKEPNIGKDFISIDMVKANFTALTYYGIMHPEFKDGKYIPSFFPEYDYDKFIRQFTDIDHIAESKYIRQVIFGNCNPKKIINYESILMNDILHNLIENKIITRDDVYATQSDEIILKRDNEKCDTIRKIKEYLSSNIKFPVNIEEFTLLKIKGTEAFVKEIHDGNGNIVFKPKCVNPDEMPFVYRFLNNEEFKEDDLIFFHNGKLAKFLEFPEIEMIIEPENTEVEEDIER